MDITERKKLDQLKSEFVSTVSHELRTPLTSIRGTLGLILGGAVSDDADQAAALLKIADKNCERLVNLVNDILDMERIESGNMEYTFALIELDDFVEEMIRTHQGYGDEFDVTFVKVGSADEARVQGDSQRL